MIGGTARRPGRACALLALPWSDSTWPIAASVVQLRPQLRAGLGEHQLGVAVRLHARSRGCPPWAPSCSRPAGQRVRWPAAGHADRRAGAGRRRSAGPTWRRPARRRALSVGTAVADGVGRRAGRPATPAGRPRGATGTVAGTSIAPARPVSPTRAAMNSPGQGEPTVGRRASGRPGRAGGQPVRRWHPAQACAPRRKRTAGAARRPRPWPVRRPRHWPGRRPPPSPGCLPWSAHRPWWAVSGASGPWRVGRSRGAGGRGSTRPARLTCRRGRACRWQRRQSRSLVAAVVRRSPPPARAPAAPPGARRRPDRCPRARRAAAARVKVDGPPLSPRVEYRRIAGSAVSAHVPLCHAPVRVSLPRLRRHLRGQPSDERVRPRRPPARRGTTTR